MLHFTHIELSNIADLQIVEWPLWLKFNITVYTGLVSDTDCDIFLLLFDLILCQISKMTDIGGSGENFTIFCKYSLDNAKYADPRSHTYSRDHTYAKWMVSHWAFVR